MSLPFFVAIFVPAFTGERLSDSSDLEIAEQLYRAQPGLVALSTEGAIQVDLSAISRPAGADARGWLDVGGGLQRNRRKTGADTRTAARDPLDDGRAAHREGAWCTAAGSCAYRSVLRGLCCGVALLAEPGVFRALLTPPSLTIVFILGPLAALAARSWPYARPRG